MKNQITIDLHKGIWFPKLVKINTFKLKRAPPRSWWFNHTPPGVFALIFAGNEDKWQPLLHEEPD